jgi:hypothetical protein
MGSPTAPPRLELPSCGRRLGKVESRARQRCVPESSTGSAMRRPSHRLVGATLGVEVTHVKLEPQALRRHLIRLGLVQRSELCYPLFFHKFCMSDGSTTGQPSNFIGIPPPRKRFGL